VDEFAVRDEWQSMHGVVTEVRQAAIEMLYKIIHAYA
jgi:hypothetical protein